MYYAMFWQSQVIALYSIKAILMNIEQHLEKTLIVCRDQAIGLIKNNIALDFNVLIGDKGELSIVDPFSILNQSTKSFMSNSLSTQLRDYCEYQLFLGNYADYLCVYFQKAIVVNSVYHLNVFIITGRPNSELDFGYHIFPYDWSEQGELEIYDSIQLDNSTLLFIENQALGLLSKYVFDN